MPNDVNTKAKSELKTRKMSNTDSPLGKSSRQQKPASHEYCQGYVDRNGIWNNGFYCPRWGSPDDTYCCGDSERFCCPEVVHAHTPPPANSSPSQSTALSSATGNADLSSLLPLIIGASVGGAVLILVLLLICVFCPCCPCHKDRRRPKRSSNPIASNRTLSFSMEAEATSAVIAAQALQLAAGGTTGTQACLTGSTSDDGHLHCGCRWSPSTSQSTMVDVDSIIASLQQNTSLPWQSEMQDNAFNCATCEHHRPQFVRILKQQNSEQVCHVLSLSAGNNSLDRSDGNRSSPLCLDSFRPPSASSSRQTDFSEEPRFVRLPVSMERSCLLGNRNPQQPGQQGHQRGGYMLSSQPGTDPRQVKSFLDSDRQRRDSGVLVEEPDLLNDTANAFLALSMLQTQTDQTGGGRTGDVDRRN